MKTQHAGDVHCFIIDVALQYKIFSKWTIRTERKRGTHRERNKESRDRERETDL